MRFALAGKEASTLGTWACLVGALAASLVYSWRYLPLTLDDALISFRYSERLLHGQGLTWNDGEFVEGYSNLLWVLLTAAGGLLHPDLILVAKVLGLLANVAALIAIVWAFGRSSDASLLAVASGLFVLALSESFAVWGIIGLETPLVEALLAWALATTYRMPTSRWGWVYPGLLLGLLAITRPDGILFGVSIPFAVVLRDGFSRAALHRAISILILPIAFAAGQLCFRLAYYGTFVPNTAHVKIAFTPERLSLGGHYLLNGILTNSVPLVMMLVTAVLLWRSRQRQLLRQTALFFIPGVVWLAYVGSIGGDMFPFHRQWMPALVCFAFALSSLLAAFPTIRSHRLASGLVVAAVLHLAFQKTVDPWVSQFGRAPEIVKDKLILQKDPNFVFRRTLRIISDCTAVGEFVRDAFGKQKPLFAVNAAGCLPYASGLPSLDMLGLTDSYIAHHRPPDMGKGPIAHELGDGAYVLSRKPDLMAFCMPTGSATPCFRGEHEMTAMAEFQQYYRLVHYRAGSVDASLWTRVEDGRIGIIRTAENIHIPGFLLATTPGVRAVLDSAGKAVASLEKGDAVIDSVYLPPGIWELSLQSDVSHLQLATSLAAERDALNTNALRIVSHGTTGSFHVFGGQGLVYAISARRVAK